MMNETSPIMVLPWRIFPSTSKTSILFAGSAVFVLGGIAMFRSNPWIGTLSISFFGLGIIVSIVQFAFKRPFLEVSEEGFTIHAIFRPSFTRWSDVSGFEVIHVPPTAKGLIGFNYCDDYPSRKKIHSVNRAITGADASLPELDMSIYQLCDLMNQLHLKYRNRE